jgi:ATP synthase subunit 6
LNLISLVIFRYPVTTTLRFNFIISFILWTTVILLYLVKHKLRATVLPVDSPWYLIPFLRVVEAVRVFVRPVTLSFRLLANIRAGHILLRLITKLVVGWGLGSLFMLLEFIVCLVQSFVLVMLVGVYLEERMSHWL